MALTPFNGTKPQRNVRSTFSTLMDAWITWFLDTFMTEIDAVVEAMNFNSTNSTSTTSVAIGSGANKSITVQASKSYVAGMTVKCAYTTDPTQWMLGDVVSYDSGTGALVFYARTKEGAGTYATWTVSQSPTTDSVGDHVVTCHTGNGHGSSNTTIRRFTTAMTNTGTAITYADSATLGATFTINEAGFYEVYYQDNITTAATGYYGISKNLDTGNVSSIAVANRMGLVMLTGVANTFAPCSRVLSLAVNDVIRPHTNGTTDGITDHTFFSIRKVSNG